MTSGQKGAILVASLWILSILSILAIGIGFRISIEARLCKYNLDRMRALYLAKAGLYRAEELLSKKGLNDPNGADSLRECGFILGNSADPNNNPEKFFKNVRLGEGSFTVGYGDTVGISDEERRLNLNTADEPTLLALLESVSDKASEGTSQSELKQIASSIVAWRTNSGANASSFLNMSSGEGDYYKNLTPPYEQKKDLFCAVEELFLVRGVTPRIFDSIKDYVTVHGDGSININTAPVEVLSAFGLKSIASAMIDNRNGPDRLPGTKDDLAVPNSNVGSYIKTLISNLPTTEQNAINMLTAGAKPKLKAYSEFFRIESKGSPDKSKVVKRIVCIVQKQKDTAKPWPILKSYREY